MVEYEPVIGLEVHAQLKTRTKIFCTCSTAFGNDPNENTCPVCTGMPGVLPVLNKRAVEYAAKMALAVDCTLNTRSIFARKNYFYPDLPKGYQISQFELPIAEHGKIELDMEGGKTTVGITRIHMEEDAGKSIHSPSENRSFVDLNRTGVPLIEIVSEPDIRSAEEAVAYLKSLRAILVYLDICDGNMEEGSFRCDANISLRPKGQKEFGTRTELKNLNSFRHVQKAIEYEIGRQEDMLFDGDKVVQETRLYDSAKDITKSMRGKEEAHDYRYFPDPDLVPLVLEESWIDGWKEELPELPKARYSRFIKQYTLPEYDAEVLTSDRQLSDYYEEAVAIYDQPKKLSNWIMSDVLRELNEARVSAAECPVSPKALAGLVEMVDRGDISLKVGKQVFTEVFKTGQDPKAYIKEKGLVQISDSTALEKAVDEVLQENPDEVEAYKNGKTKLMGFFVGQIMRKTKGQANPKVVNQLLQSKLS